MNPKQNILHKSSQMCMNPISYKCKTLLARCQTPPSVRFAFNNFVNPTPPFSAVLLERSSHTAWTAGWASRRKVTMGASWSISVNVKGMNRVALGFSPAAVDDLDGSWLECIRASIIVASNAVGAIWRVNHDPIWAIETFDSSVCKNAWADPIINVT